MTEQGMREAVQHSDADPTPRRMTDVFKQEYGMTPKEYADPLRLREANRLLAATPEKAIDIAYRADFSSLTAFNRFLSSEPGKHRQNTERSIECHEGNCYLSFAGG